MGSKLRIAIDCRIRDPRQGIGTAVLALAKALSESKITNQEYTFVVFENMEDWLAPYVSGPCKVEGVPGSNSSIKSFVRSLPFVRFVWSKLRVQMKHVPVSNGFVESRGFDVVHFPTQVAYLTDIPSIYQPWDLQHLHYPQFFSATELDHRERYYRGFCNHATFVCVQAHWTKQDLIEQFGIAEDKVVVIPWGSVFDAYKAPSAETTRVTVEKYSLPEQFFVYPAITWPHKNHEVILRALQALKSDQKRSPHVYFTGSSTDFRPVLDKLALDLGVQEQVHFLGFLAPEELQSLFYKATAMIFASKFEGFGLPILEAFHASLPILCSNATTLPEVARDGALYFDPDSHTELASLMCRILDDPELRKGLVQKGAQLLTQSSIHSTVAGFQSLYERTAALSAGANRASAAGR